MVTATRGHGLFHVEPAARKPGVLMHLDPSAPAYPRLAAQAIADLPEVSMVGAALREVEPRFLTLVTTLAILGWAMRIAKMDRMEQRRAALEAFPSELRGQLEPHVRRLFVSRPWDQARRVR